eukprot:scaffold51559_cov31-Tisochrysis_lutea.AAC.3
MARPSETAISLRKIIIEEALAESIPEVGSSRKSTWGCLANAMAIESRRLRPLERPRMKALPALTCWDSMWLAKIHGVAQVVAGAEGCPERVLLLHICAVLVVECTSEGLAIELNLAARHAALLLECEHVEKCRLAGT